VVLLTVGWIDRHIQDNATRLKTRKALIYIGILIVLVALLKVWILREKVNITTVAGIMGAGITLALQQQILCLAGWLVLIVHRYYDVGDRVQIGDVKGDVSDIGIFHTTLVEIGGWVGEEQSTGRLVTVPNSHIFSLAIYNYTRGFEYIWNEFPILITYESDWHKAQQIILDFAKEGVEEIQEKFRTQIKTMAQKRLIHFTHLAPIVYPKIADSGIQLTLRYLCEPKRRRSSAADLSAKILDAFAKEPDIDFAYPTQRRYDNLREGKNKPSPPPPGPSDSPS
jgi:small-conductance mechanosensitive channel